jgi:hypothetical protein
MSRQKEEEEKRVESEQIYVYCLSEVCVRKTHRGQRKHDVAWEEV